MVGLEPTTPALRKPCSTVELHRRKCLFYKYLRVREPRIADSLPETPAQPTATETGGTGKRARKFPLTLHPTGQCCKKICGKMYYFGTDKQQGLQRHDQQSSRYAPVRAGQPWGSQIRGSSDDADHSRDVGFDIHDGSAVERGDLVSLYDPICHFSGDASAQAPAWASPGAAIRCRLPPRLPAEAASGAASCESLITASSPAALP